MWNSIITAPGYCHAGLQSGSGCHINLPSALPRSQTYDVSHIAEGDPVLFSTLWFLSKQLQGPARAACTAASWTSTGRASVQLPAEYPMLKIS